MKRVLFFLFTMIGFCFSHLNAQQIFRPFDRQSVVPENLRLSLLEHIDQYQLLTINYEVVENLIDQKPLHIQIPLPVTAEHTTTLNLERYDILSPDVQLVKGTDNGDVPQNFNNRFVSYKAVWSGTDRPLTIINFTDYHINGIVEVNGELYELGALKGFDKEKPKDFIIYPTSHLKQKPSFDCHTDENLVDPSLSRQIEQIKSNPPFDVMSSTLLVCEVAVEMDYQAYVYYGNSAENATAFVLTLFATSSAVYNRDINVMFSIPYVRVWTTPSDPYTDNPSSSSVLLNEFRNHWNANMRHIPRDIAHYASPRNQGLGGVAWLTSLCASVINGYGYGFSDYQSGTSITPLPTYSWQVMVVTHEIGHNFGSPHTHSCDWNPPIDTCYYGPETQCVTGTGCTLNSVCIPRLGTIMSYCHLTSAGSRMYFGPLPSSLIRSYAQSASCFSASAKPIRVGQPNGHETYSTRTSATGANPTTIITWGSSLTDPVDIHFSPDSGQTWQTVVTSIPSGTREYTWSIPYVQTTHNALIRVSKSGDPSVSDTSDTPFSILLKLWSFNNISPVNNATIYVDSNDYTPYTFIWGRSGDIPQIVYKYHFKKTTVTTPVAILLSNNNGQDTSITLTGRQIDSIITSWNMWAGDSLRAHWYGVAYNLGDTIRASVRFNITVRRNTIDIPQNDPARLTDYILYPCYPNPFNPSTTIAYGLPERSRVTVKIYNMLGQEVRTLVNTLQEKGLYSVQWDGTNQTGQRVSSGMYFYSLETPAAKRIRKMTLLK